MFAFVLLLLVFAGSMANKFEKSFGLDCSVYESYTVVEDPKKTKAWKKCNENNVKLRECIGETYKVVNRASLIDEDETRCEYIRSHEHIVRYSEVIAREKAKIVRKHQLGTANAEYIGLLKEAFIEITSTGRAADVKANMTERHLENISELYSKRSETMSDLLSEIEQLTLEYIEKLDKKKKIVYVEMEEGGDLHEDNPLHEERRTLFADIKEWTYAPTTPWWKTFMIATPTAWYNNESPQLLNVHRPFPGPVPSSSAPEGHDSYFKWYNADSTAWEYDYTATYNSLGEDHTYGGPCPSSHPYVYYNGNYCCAVNREKYYAPDGEKCDGSEIKISSLCCEGDRYTKCPYRDEGLICSDYIGNNWATTPTKYMGWIPD